MVKTEFSVDWEGLKKQVDQLRDERNKTVLRVEQLTEALDKLQNWLSYVERIADYQLILAAIPAVIAGTVKDIPNTFTWPTQLEWPGQTNAGD